MAFHIPLRRAVPCCLRERVVVISHFTRDWGLLMQNVGRDAFLRWLAEKHEDPSTLFYTLHSRGREDFNVWMQVAPETGRQRDEYWCACRRGEDYFLSSISAALAAKIGVVERGGVVTHLPPGIPPLSLLAVPYPLSESANIDVICNSESMSLRGSVRLLRDEPAVQVQVAMHIGGSTIAGDYITLLQDPGSELRLQLETPERTMDIVPGMVSPVFVWFQRTDPYWSPEDGTPRKFVRVSTISSCVTVVTEE